MINSKPTVVFIPGFWHTPEGFTPLAKVLEKEGYPSVLVNLPSAGAHPGHPDFSQDVAAIRKIIIELADEGKEVMVVMHSGGSVSGSEASRDLGKKERQAEGKNGGIVRVIYIGILLPSAGKTMFETFQGVVSRPDLDPDFVIDPDQSFHVFAEDGTSTSTDGDTRFYNDLSAEDAKYWSSKLTSLSLGVGMSPLTYEAWKYIPSAYIMPLQDKSIPLKQVRQIVKEANIEMVFEIETGHCPYLVQPETVAGFIRKAGGEII
ncbi:uncharacterized protein EAF02_003934 [Botrytis sinoallii]|uniref:uncharacterized protein n=1 Tax=Botrytis sinoallii TaxID=1463999 RepID=UPI00190296BF|nr:uncharacterized protein EAF02_003934 [Botrytis sinoallii]KAF7885425.1 hypothetical protein EAF02_003934 [Botrytis sinoallii]